jgi:hypothetical protein
VSPQHTQLRDHDSMASDAPASDPSLPVKVAEPDISAPPTLAEPESGHVADMPGVGGDANSEEKPADDGEYFEIDLSTSLTVLP